MRRSRWPLRPQAPSHRSPLAPPASATKPRCGDASLLSGLRADWDECGVACGAAVRARDGSREGYACGCACDYWALLGSCLCVYSPCSCLLLCSNESSVSTVFGLIESSNRNRHRAPNFTNTKTEPKTEKNNISVRFGSVRFGYNVPRLREHGRASSRWPRCHLLRRQALARRHRASAEEGRLTVHGEDGRASVEEEKPPRWKKREVCLRYIKRESVLKCRFFSSLRSNPTNREMIMRLGENLTDVDLEFDYNNKNKQSRSFAL
jgi:hypothetical protein